MRRLWLLCLLGCHDGGSVERPGVAVIPPQDAAPAPDAASPDVGREGPPDLVLDPAPLVVREGRTAPLTVTVSGALDAPLDLRISAEGVRVEPPTLRFEPAGPRMHTVQVTAPFDDDEAAGAGEVRVVGDALDERVAVVIPDVHLTLTLDLDEAQLAFVRSSNDKSRRLFVGTRIGSTAGPEAEINLRGKGTLPCPRRSFTVRFDDPVRMGDSPPLEHVLLLSTCLDSTYLKMPTSTELLADQGLFPGWYSLAEVRYGGGSRGVYLVVERPRKALSRAFPANTTVVRRLNDRAEELKRPNPDDIPDVDAVLAPYRALYDLRGQASGAEQLALLRRHMDYDLYLRWLAINSLLHNGDYIDEVYFYDRAGPTGSATPYFAVMAWDYDDIFTGCHTRGPLDEPLLFCSESSLDRPVHDTPEVTDAYLGYLRALMNGPLDLARYDALVQRYAAEMAVYLDRPGVAEVMTRDDVAPDMDGAVRAIREGAAARRAALEAVMP